MPQARATDKAAFRALDRFTRAKGLPRVSKVIGGPVRAAYLDPRHIRVFTARR